MAGKHSRIRMATAQQCAWVSELLDDDVMHTKITFIFSLIAIVFVLLLLQNRLDYSENMTLAIVNVISVCFSVNLFAVKIIDYQLQYVPHYYSI